jgi:heme exporter protein A
MLQGPNGSGKSSLLRVVAGLLKPASGELLWNEQPIQAEPEAHRARLHYVGHLDAVKPAMTVAETLAFFARTRGSEALTSAALARFGLGGLKDIPGRFLSAGQKRRLALARLLATPAPLWLLDEPSVTLDTESCATLEALMAEHRADGGMIVLATHAALKLEGAQRLDLARYQAAAPAAVAGARSGRANGFAEDAW